MLHLVMAFVLAAGGKPLLSGEGTSPCHERIRLYPPFGAANKLNGPLGNRYINLYLAGSVVSAESLWHSRGGYAGCQLRIWPFNA